MMYFPDPIKSTDLVVYTSSQHSVTQARTDMEKMQNLFMESSFKTQMADCHLSAVTVRAFLLSGAMPPQIGPGLPERFPGTMSDLLDGVRENEPCTVRETVNRTVNDINYNGLQPFNKTAKQISEGRRFLETRIDSRNEEETGSICCGMSHALLKQLSDLHGIDGMYAAQRKKGKAFEHAAVIIECADGYALLDPRSHPDYRIFPIPFDGRVIIHDKTFTAANPGSQIPIFETNPEGEFEYCTNIANGDDLVMKHFMMKAPFNPPKDPAFPISAYYLGGEKMGRSSRTIWVSPLRAKLTFKNDTVKEANEKTVIISFTDVLKSGFHAQLERFYVAGKPPTFNVDVESLYEQLVQFVKNAGIIDEMFREIYSDKSN